MLTDLQKRFCDIYIQQGGKNGAECARLAGYADTGDAAKVRAAALLRNEDVLAEIRRLAQCRISAAVAEAFDLGLSCGIPGSVSCRLSSLTLMVPLSSRQLGRFGRLIQGDFRCS